MIGEYENSEFCDRIENVAGKELKAPRAYGLTQNHKHLPEMKKYCKLDKFPIFSPIVSNYYSGMLTSLPLHVSLLRRKLDINELYEIYANYYKDETMVRVIEPGAESQNGFLAGNRLAEKNYLELMVCGNAEAITVYASFDNLGKGASGAAVQCMNLMLGLPEATGLLD